jgi:hypothetical protein
MMLDNIRNDDANRRLEEIIRGDYDSFASKYSRIKELVSSPEDLQKYSNAIRTLYQSDPFSALGITQFIPLEELGGLEDEVTNQLKTDSRLCREIAINIIREKKIKTAQKALLEEYDSSPKQRRSIILALMAINPSKNIDILESYIDSEQNQDERVFVLANVLYDIDNTEVSQRIKEGLDSEIYTKVRRYLTRIEQSQ